MEDSKYLCNICDQAFESGVDLEFHVEKIHLDDFELQNQGEIINITAKPKTRGRPKKSINQKNKGKIVVLDSEPENEEKSVKSDENSKRLKKRGRPKKVKNQIETVCLDSESEKDETIDQSDKNEQNKHVCIF